MKKKIQGVLALVLSGVLLAGCTETVQTPTANTQTTTQPTAVTEITTQPTEEITQPTQPVLPPPSLEPVTRLTSIRWRTFPQFLSLGNGTLVACQNYFEEGSGIVNFMDVFNLYDDEVLTRSRNESPRELVAQTFSDGCFVLSDPKENTFYVYNQNLQVQTSFPAPNTQGYFSHDRSAYFFVQDRVLYRMDVASGNFGRMGLQKDLRLEELVSIHPTEDILCVKISLSPYQERWGMGLIDCTTGKLLFLREDVEHLWLDGDRFYAAAPNDQVFGYDIYFGSLTGGALQYVTTQTLGSDTVSYSVLPGSGYMVLRTVDEENLTTTVYDLEQGSLSCPMDQYEYITSTLVPLYLEQEQLIFGLYPDGYDFAPVVIDPKVLAFEAGLTLETGKWDTLLKEDLLLSYEEEQKGPALPTLLQEQRSRADAIEEKYGVEILLGHQADTFWESQAETVEDPIQIDQALTIVDTALSLYPKNFLSQLRNGIKEGGIYLCLTGRISGELSPVGRTKPGRDRYEIALDITADALDKTIHHELWHAIEMKLSVDRFDHPQWNACNPKGFTYYGSYDSGYAAWTADTFAKSGPDCAFVDAYAKINASEDRARLMEYVMATDAADLLQSKVLRQKLDIISKTLRQNFNTTGWNTPYWERYF